MSDMDGLMALLKVVTDPATAKKNIAEMEKLKELKKENTAILKEANAANFKLNIDREKLQAGWAEINEARATMESARSNFALEVAGLDEMKAEASAEVEKKKAQVKEIENAHNKKMVSLKARYTALEGDVATIQRRRSAIEGDLAALRQKVG